ncbi:MAG: RNA polymerase sigma factor [Planctomycetota bacterium]|mgnify:FL=1
MLLVKRSERSAFTELIHRYERPLLNFFRRMGADIHSAEDGVQETFIRLFNYRKEYQPKARFTTFLYTLARHVWSDEIRRAKRKSKTTGFTDTLEVVQKTNSLEPGERLDIQAALNGLSEKLRSVIVLSIYQGLNYQEIAAILDIPLGTVKSRAWLALRQLRERLKVYSK